MSTALINRETTYLDGDTYGVINTLAAKNLVAMVDEETNMGQSLYLGASKDINLEAKEGFKIQLGASNALVVSDHSNVPSFKLETDATTTTLSGVDKNLVLTTTDNTSKSIFVGALEVAQSNDYQVIRTSMSDGLLMDDNLRLAKHGMVEQSLAVAGNAICNGSVYAQHCNFVKSYPNASNAADPSLVGYAFTVNDNDQLELLNHTTFSNGNKVSKRIGTFGMNRLSDADVSDTPYAQFEKIKSLSFGGSPTVFAARGGAPSMDTGSQKSVITMRSTGTDDPYLVNSVDRMNVLTNASLSNSATAQWGSYIPPSGGSTWTESISVHVDSYGNVYTAGNAYPTPDDNDIPFLNADGSISSVRLNARPGNHSFVVKYSPDGFAQWVVSICSDDTLYCNNAAIDTVNGAVYVTGVYLKYNLDLTNIKMYNADGSVSPFELRPPSHQQSAGFLMKVSLNGTAEWVASIDHATSVPGDMTNITASQVVIDPAGDFVYLAGSYRGQPTIFNAGNVANTVVTLPESTGSGYLLAFDASGIAQRATRFDGTPVAMSSDPSRNVFVGVNAPEAAKVYNPGNIDSGATLAAGAYVQVFSANGVYQSHMKIPSLTTFISMDVDNACNVFVMLADALPQALTLENADGTTSTVTIPAAEQGNSTIIIKYSSLGVVQWAAVIDGTRNTGSNGNSMTVDINGNVYTSSRYTNRVPKIYSADASLSSITLRPAKDELGFVSKFDSNGIAQWAIGVDAQSSSFYSVLMSIAVDSNGNVYFCGLNAGGVNVAYNSDQSDSAVSASTPATTSFHACTYKYSPRPQSATVQWGAQVLSGVGWTYVVGETVCTDSQGNIYMTGTTVLYTVLDDVRFLNSDGSISDVRLKNRLGDHTFIVKYNSSGFVQWAMSMCSFDEQQQTTFGVELAVDDVNKALYFTGKYMQAITIYNSDGNASEVSLRAPDSAAFLLKASFDGTAMWAASLDAPFAIGERVVVDPLGEVVYVVGQSSGQSTIYNAGNVASSTVQLPMSRPCFLVAFNKLGTAQWVLSLSGSYTVGLAIDVTGNLYVGTNTYSTSSVIYNAGNSSSSVTLTTGSHIIKFSKHGIYQTHFTATPTPALISIAIDNVGNIYAAYATSLIKYSSVGVPQWVGVVDGSDIVMSITVDVKGNVYACGYYSSGVPRIYNADGGLSSVSLKPAHHELAFAIQYNKNGVAQWAVGIEGSVSRFYDIAVDSSNNVYTTGFCDWARGVAYNSDHSDSDVALPSPENNSTSCIIKYSQVPSYKLLSNLDNTKNGFEKVLLNSSNRPCTVFVSDSSNTVVSKAVRIAPQSKESVIWYESEWY